MSGGWNPTTGRDASGGRPYYAPYGVPVVGQGQAYIPHAGGPGYNYGIHPHFHPRPNMTYPAHPGHPPFAAHGAYYQMPGAAPFPGQPMPTTTPYAHQPNGAGNMFARQPQPYPSIDPDMPAAQMTNATGGLGCEPGYNYFFPAVHTKAHIFRSNTPPWQLPASAQMQFKAAYIPCGTTIAELLKGFGCTNATPKKNRVFEIVSAGGGKWYKGMEINGTDRELLGKTVRDIGWDETRSGLPNGKPVVCLWFAKD